MNLLPQRGYHLGGLFKPPKICEELGGVGQSDLKVGAKQ